MLVLARKAGERIQLGDNVTVRVLSIHEGRVRLGIEAPETIRIRRAELPASTVPTTIPIVVPSLKPNA